jgi:hypothetical protein
MWRARFAVFGTPPRVAPWHPRWPDFDPVLKSLERLCSNTDELLVLSNSPRAFAQWLAERRQSGTSLEIARLLGYSRRQYLPLVGKFAVCFLFLTEGDLKECDEIIRRVGPLLKPGGHLLIVASNDQTGDARVFAESFAYHSGRFVNLPLWVSEQRYVEVSKLRWRVHQHMMRVGRAAAERPRHLLPFYLAAGGGLTVLSYFCNRSVRSSPEPPAGAGCSSVFMVLRAPEDSSSVPLPRFTIEREANRMPLSKRGPSEDRFVALRSERGLESLGLMANQAWHDDPRQLGFVLARYRFIAGLLNGRHDVGEVGCGDAFGTRIVLGEVKKVTVYDSNPIFIDDVHRRYREEWPLDAHVHDILREPLSRKHDSIYSMDAIQHVPPEEEDTFVRHLRDSLSSDHDLVIVGGPSQEHAGSFDRDASAAIYRRGGSKIKALMERYFHAVFMFSMVGEAVFSGTVPGAHHFFALCCGRK